MLPSRVDAQIGGLIKKKVTESVKGGDKKAATTEPDADASDKSKMPRPITANTFVAFKKGLTVERNKQQEAIKFLAGVTPVAKYKECSVNIMMTPEGQKIALKYGNAPDNATVQQLQDMAQKLGAEMQKLTDKQCGEDPTKYHTGQWKVDRFKEAKAAGLAAFSAALDSPSGNNGPYFAFEVEATQQQQRDDNYFFDLLMEWIPPFCLLSKAAQQAAADKGVAVPGSSKGLNYVYTAMEARLLMPQCEEIMNLLKVLEK
jgi:hypothetical protein